MTMFVNGLLIAIGGFFGAISRFSVSQWVNSRFRPRFPYGTLAVNLLGSFLLGMLAGLGVTGLWYRLLGIGFLGAFTTFSTFKLEMIQFGRHKHWRAFAAYLFVSYMGGVFLAFLGLLGGINLSLLRG